MITGRVKILERNLASVQEGARATASDGTDGNNLIAENNETVWQSLARTGTVEITINLPPTRANRIILLDHNLSSFAVSGTFNNLTNIANAPMGAIDLVQNTRQTSYFAFDQINVTSITLTLRDTISPGEFKRIGRFILCQEFGTFEGWPVISPSFNDNARRFKSKAGEILISKQRRTLDKISLIFKNYTKLNDIDLIQRLHRYDQPVLIWPSGGREEQFRFAQEGFRNKDLYKVKSMGSLPIRLDKGSYSSLLDSRISFSEVI